MGTYTQMMEIRSARFNDVYRSYMDDETRTQIFFGGASSGKSVFVVGQRVIHDLIKGDRNYLIIRNVAGTSRNSTFNEVKKIILDWKVSEYFKVNKSEMIISCIINGAQAMFAGLDDVEKLKSITPAKGVVTDILVEEATETTEGDLKQLQKRLRGKSKVKKRMTLVFNPIMRSHWIHNTYFKGRFHDGDAFYQDDDLLILKTTYKDNLKFLEEDDIQALENETNEYFYNVYTLGNWGSLGDVIFTNWKVKDLSRMIPPFDNIRNGLDFGYANDPAAFNRMHYDKKRKLLYIFKEMHEFGLTNPQLADRIKPIIDRERLTCDSAEPKSIQELKDHNINAVGAMKGRDSINFGIQWLQGHQIIIDAGCQETINEFQVYQWKKTKQGETINTPVDRNNHHIDCFVGSTLITTQRGQIRIDSLLDKDKVLTRSGFKNILWHKKTKVAETTRAVFSDGTMIEGTKTHRFITDRNRKKPLYLLMPYDVLLGNRGILQWLANRLFTRVINIGEGKEEIQNILKDETEKGKLYICIGRYIKMLMVKLLILTTKRGFVFFAEKCLKSINMLLLKRVHVVAVTDTGIKKEVYNLEVNSDLHEYYANGLLVANCIRYAMENDMSKGNRAGVW